MDKILNFKFLGNSIYSYLKTLIAFLIFSSIVFVSSRVILKVLSKVKNLKDNVAVRLSIFVVKRFAPLFYLFSFLLSLEFLNLTSFKTILHSFDKGILAFSIIYLIISIIDFVVSEIQLTTTLEDNQKQTLRLLSIIIKIIVILLGLVFIIKNFIPTFEITSILTTFGVGGVVVGLALQKTLQDVLNYFALVFDKPFFVGDYILFDTYQGTVKRIGIRSTRILSLSGEEISVPNSVITSAVIKNYSRLETRRIQTKVSVSFDTNKEKLEKVSDILKSSVESVEKTAFAFARLSNFGNYSFDFTLAYYINELDYNKFMELQEKVNIAIVDNLKKEGILLTYPIEVVKLDRQQ